MSGIRRSGYESGASPAARSRDRSSRAEGSGNGPVTLHADDGLLASKPYAASGNYIRRMSNFCQGCAYDPSVSVGERACPFNALYWDFLARHRPRFSGNARMPYVYSTLDKMGADKQAALRRQAEVHIAAMREGRL